ncbi:hypothetical protein BDP27DRAFT_96719 [Rhodocollybia butyracea]|uniref:Uncharacterized protein n=1 Tax=Rhodocollybia butyracea TaxID=206335 RepID=A0A9P5UE75_9AGAR|nr:hypothetical protein BDP27DRAFT_96719 [Rhodocollybia butyracea]
MHVMPTYFYFRCPLLLLLLLSVTCCCIIHCRFYFRSLIVEVVAISNTLYLPLDPEDVALSLSSLLQHCSSILRTFLPLTYAHDNLVLLFLSGGCGFLCASVCLQHV